MPDSVLAGAPVTFETHPASYRHWILDFQPPVATLSMNVREDAALQPGYRLKLNSYDLGVDIELADAIQRIRFERPDIRVVIITSAKDRVFCAGANIFMLASASHAFKVNFCKFTNETRLAIEDASAHSGIRFIAAVNGVCAGGGYELALACDEIMLIDDGASAVSLPETALLGVLPGTGGLTRLVDKRKVRRDLADAFCTVAEGVKGRRALEWGLVDRLAPTSRFREDVAARARDLAAQSDRPDRARGVAFPQLAPLNADTEWAYSLVTMRFERAARSGELVIAAPVDGPPSSPGDAVEQSERFWPLRAFRELDDVLLRIRLNEPEIGTIMVRTSGDPRQVLAFDEWLHANRQDWFVREVIHFIKRTLKRMELTSRSFFAIIEPGNAFAGTLFEVALACDRSFMLDEDGEDDRTRNSIALSVMNGGSYPMANGLSRLASRFLARPHRVDELLSHAGAFTARAAAAAGLVTVAPDALDWDDEVRIAVEERAALSPDALTGMEANLRFAGPETLETKIFGRLSAWQNWIFQRPNAAGETGALTTYGREGRPSFDWRRC